MSSAADKAHPNEARSASMAMTKAFWESAEQFATAAEKVAQTPRKALLEGGAKSHGQRVTPDALAEKLASLSGQIDRIRERLTGDRKLVSQSQRKQAERYMRRLVEEGALVSATELIEVLNVSRQALSKSVKQHRLFYVEVAGERYYPAFFIDRRYERRQLEQVSRVLGELPGASKLQFFLTPKASLDGQTPLDALAGGKYSRVRIAAEGFADR